MSKVSSNNWWHDKLREQGIRLTAPRRAVLEVLSKTSNHLSAEDIYIEAHKSYTSPGLTSVYRTLELFVQMGLVHKFKFGDGRARYELSEYPKGKEHHHHLVCTGCGKIVNYSDFIEEERKFIKITEDGLSKKFGFKITKHIVHFYGLCNKCQSKK
jgi:Fur family ferric uptake transcriptional regulator